MSRIFLTSLKYSYRKLNRATTAVQNKIFLRSIVPCLNCWCSQHYYATAAERSKKIDSKMHMLDQTVRRLGRTILQEVESTLDEVQATGTISITQSLMILRSCGSLLIDVKPHIRMKFVHRIWKLLQDLNVKLNISHYNALLQVYLENNYSFSPSEILSDIEAMGFEPNRVTFQRLITRYCQMGDVVSAIRILRYMREKDIPVNESVFNSLIIGYSQNNNMDNAENILRIMKSSRIEPSSNTFTQLICGYIKNCMLDKVKETFTRCEDAGLVLAYKDYFNIIYAYAMHGYDQEIDKVVNMITKDDSYNHNAKNFAYKLLTADKIDAAYKVVKSMQKIRQSNGTSNPIGNFYIAYLVTNDEPSEIVIKYALDLMKENLNDEAFSIGVENALRLGKEKVALDMLRLAKEKNLMAIRCHYFWPLLVNRAKKGEATSLCDILIIMHREFGLLPCDDTVRDYIVPLMLRSGRDVGDILVDMKSCGMSTKYMTGHIVCHLLQEGRISEAANVANAYTTAYAPKAVKGMLINCFLKTRDVDSFVQILQDVNAYLLFISTHDNPAIDRLEYIGAIIEAVVAKLITKDESVIEKLLNKLLEVQMGISEERVKSIENLVKDALSPEIIVVLKKLASEELATLTFKTKPNKLTLIEFDYEALERFYETVKSKGEEPSVNLKRSLFIAHARARNLEKMEKFKEELEAENFNFDTTLQINMLDAYAHRNRAQEALQIYQTLCDANADFQLRPVKTVSLAAALVQNGQYEEAKEILKRTTLVATKKESHESSSAIVANFCSKLLNTLAKDGDVGEMNEFFNLLISSKLVDENDKLLSSLIKERLVGADHSDLDNMQELSDLNAVLTKINMATDLMVQYLESGRIHEAREMLESKGLSLNGKRLRTMCNNYVKTRSMEHLRNLLKLTNDVALIDRAFVCDKLLDIYLQQDDVQKSLALWTEMQDEDILPSDNFLIRLAKHLQKNGMSVPFTIPAVTTSSTTTFAKAKPRKRVRGLSKKLKELVEGGHFDAAIDLVKTKNLSKDDYTILVRALLQNDRYPEAKRYTVKFFEKTGHVLKGVFKYFLSHAAKNADVDFLLEWSHRLRDEFKRKITFCNFLAFAYLKAGRVDEYMCEWENALKHIQNKQQLDKFLISYPRSTIVDIMCEKPEYVARVKAFTEKCAQIDENNLMWNVLWTYHMIRKELDEANKIYDKYLKNGTQIFFTRILRQIWSNLDVELGRKLLSVLESKPDIKTGAIAAVYDTLIDAYVQRNEIEEAKKCLEEALNKMTIEQLRKRALKTLKSACLAKNIPFPYEIPEEISREGHSNEIDNEEIEFTQNTI